MLEIDEYLKVIHEKKLEPLRIALFHNSNGGGAKRAVYHLCAGLLKRGHSIDVFVPETANESYLPLTSLGISVNCYGPIRKPTALNMKPFLIESYLDFFHQWRYQVRSKALNLRIALRIDHSNYDVVWVDRCRATSSPFILKYLKTPTVYYCHEPWREGYEDMVIEGYSNVPVRHSLLGRTYLWLCEQSKELQRSYLRYLDRTNARSANRLVTNSRYTSEYIERAYGKEAQVSYLGVDTELFRPLWQKREHFALSVGRLQQLKRHELTIQALGLIPIWNRPKFVIIADRESARNTSELKALAKELRVDLEIIFNISDAELVGWYNRAALVVYMPVREPFGLVSIEAMACGTPVIGVREGGLQESIVDGTTGFLIDPEPEACAKAIQTLIDDAHLREEMGQAAIEHVKQNWAWENAVERFEHHLYEARTATAADNDRVPKVEKLYEDLLVSSPKAEHVHCSKSIRIAYASPYPLIFGAEKSLLNLLSSINRDRFTPYVITALEGPFADAVRNLGVQVDMMEWLDHSKCNNLIRWFVSVWCLANWLHTHQINILELNTAYHVDIKILVLACKLTGTKLVFRNRDHKKWLPLFDKLCVSHIDQIISVSKGAIAPWLKKRRSDLLFRIEPDRVRIIPSGRNIHELQAVSRNRELMRSLGIPDGNKIVGMVAGIDPNKRQDLFVEIAEIISKQISSVSFVVVGSSYGEQAEFVSYEKRIRQMVWDRRLENRVTFTGYRYDAIELIKNFDALVLPSDHEALGGVLIEAIALGVPVIASCVDGIPEVIEDGRTGLLVKDQNPHDYANAIMDVLSNHELAKQISEAGKTRAKNFDNTRITKLFEECYEELIPAFRNGKEKVK